MICLCGVASLNPVKGFLPDSLVPLKVVSGSLHHQSRYWKGNMKASHFVALSMTVVVVEMVWENLNHL